MSSPVALTTTYHTDTYPAISPTSPALTQFGETILITGGGSGIGFEITRSFAKASASRIIIVGRRDASLEESVVKLRNEFKTTEFITCQGDIGSDDSITFLWEFLYSQNIFVHVLVLNTAYVSESEYSPGVDILSLDKATLAQSAKFVKQVLSPAGQQLNQLNLIGVSTAAIHESCTSYARRNGAAKLFGKSGFKWDSFALPADFSVWAASPEAYRLHGRYVWPHWDVNELRADSDIQKQLQGKGVHESRSRRIAYFR
ncbi:hypothetical protein BDP27DRAFT_1495390 [Rhodocollybia butyracea]|uniref:Uncharacterized protein n=1 Tax=Rhodocollybia butyracea TaxID=206335 RepID=A0A9P5TZ55_9AGAR|nr:hypothetical protein BDP27DRAFT_1495390 [Rhodocollybia butyracea]